MTFQQNVYEFDQQAYDYEGEEHTHENVTGDATNDVAVGDETPKRTRRQTAAEPAEYVYEEAQQADPEENVRLLCCSFQRYLV